MQVLANRGEELRKALAEQGSAADAFQRPLRSRCQARLKTGVAMTSNVKSGEQTFLRSSCCVVSSVHQKRRSQEEPTGDPAAIRGLAPT